jgi:hypothetical protein
MKVQRLSRNRVRVTSYYMETGDICIIKYFYLPLLCIIHKVMEDKKYKLYSLNDETGIRYIGVTKQRLLARLSGHISSCKRSFRINKSRHHRHCWIKFLLDKGLKPTIHLISVFETAKEAFQAEIDHIKLYNNLVNSTSGGEGANNYKFSQEQLDGLRSKVDQYDKKGNFIKTFESLSAAVIAVTGNVKNNGKLSQVIKGKYGRRTAFGYVWRKHGESFNKYPTTPQINITEAQKKALSERQLKNNVMKNRKGLLNATSRPVLILNKKNVILNIAESVRDSANITGFSRSCVANMLKMNKEVAGYKLAYANEDIVQSLQKCKSLTLKAFVGQIYE